MRIKTRRSIHIGRIGTVLSVAGQVREFLALSGSQIALHMDLNGFKLHKILSVELHGVLIVRQCLNVILDVVRSVAARGIVGQTEGRALRLHIVNKADVVVVVENLAPVRLP